MLNSKRIHEHFWSQTSQIIPVIKKQGPISRHLQRILMILIKPIKFAAVLDIGCGMGPVLNLVSSTYPRAKCKGIDISEKAVRQAKIEYPDMIFKVADIVRNPIKEKFDLILCLDVLEHISQDWKALQNISKAASKYLVISTLLGKMRKSEWTIGHVRNYEERELLEKVRSSGFKIVKVVRWGFPFYSPLYRDALEFLGKLNADKKRAAIPNIFSIPGIMLLAEPVYQLMRLNIPQRGDYIFVLAKKEGEGK